MNAEFNIHRRRQCDIQQGAAVPEFSHQQGAGLGAPPALKQCRPCRERAPRFHPAGRRAASPAEIADGALRRPACRAVRRRAPSTSERWSTASPWRALWIEIESALTETDISVEEAAGVPQRDAERGPWAQRGVAGQSIQSMAFHRTCSGSSKRAFPGEIAVGGRGEISGSVSPFFQRRLATSGAASGGVVGTPPPEDNASITNETNISADCACREHDLSLPEHHPRRRGGFGASVWRCRGGRVRRGLQRRDRRGTHCHPGPRP